MTVATFFQQNIDSRWAFLLIGASLCALSSLVVVFQYENDATKYMVQSLHDAGREYSRNVDSASNLAAVAGANT